METHEMHRKFAADCFNQTWELLDKGNRTKDEDALMIHTAHASRYHWEQIGKPLHFARGDWQISRVYAVLGFGVMSHRYAKRCLDWCEKENLGDFDLAFAYESLARACSVSGDIAKVGGYIRLARDAAESIQKEADKAYLLSELKTIPGYEEQPIG